MLDLKYGFRKLWRKFFCIVSNPHTLKWWNVRNLVADPMATSGAPSWRPVEPDPDICGFSSFWGISSSWLVDSAPSDAPSDPRVVTDTWKVIRGSPATFFILTMTLSDAYFMMWENPNFTENRKFSFILKEKCSGEKTQDYSPDEKKFQNALESRLSIQFRWDRSMTELEVTIFEPTKKFLDLATGGAAIWAQQAQITQKTAKSPGFGVFAQYFVSVCRIHPSKVVEKLFGVLTHVILRSQVIWTHKTEYKRFWKKYDIWEFNFFSIYKGFLTKWEQLGNLTDPLVLGWDSVSKLLSNHYFVLETLIWSWSTDQEALDTAM